MTQVCHGLHSKPVAARSVPPVPLAGLGYGYITGQGDEGRYPSPPRPCYLEGLMSCSCCQLVFDEGGGGGLPPGRCFAGPPRRANIVSTSQLGDAADADPCSKGEAPDQR